MPTQAPTGSMEESFEITAILARDPGSRATDWSSIDAVIDFRHFLSEQLGHELGMGARQENLRPALFAAHVVDIGANAVAIAEQFARDQLVAPHDAFAATKVDDDIAVFDPLDHAVDDLADTVLVFVVLAVALGFAHLLHDDLLGGLGGDPAEVHRRQRLGDIIAQLSCGIALFGFFKRDLGRDVVNNVRRRAAGAAGESRRSRH